MSKVVIYSDISLDSLKPGKNDNKKIMWIKLYTGQGKQLSFSKTLKFMDFLIYLILRINKFLKSINFIVKFTVTTLIWKQLSAATSKVSLKTGHRLQQ